MKNTILFIMFFTIFFNVNGQKNNICGKIEFTYTTNLDYVNQEKYELYFNRNFSYSKEKDITKAKNEKSQEDKPMGTQVNIVVGRKNITSKYYYNSINSFYFRDNFFDEVMLVKEEKLKAFWKLHSETKKLSNFLCKKATIRFRGRDYIAWYTEQIPVPYGPWKLRNLPGIILEFYDTEKVFHAVANKIKVGEDNCLFEFDNKELENAMSLNAYLKRKEELIDNMFAEMSSRRSKGSKPFKRDKNCDDCSKEIEIFYDKN
jgi:GLPGLI family protein